MQPYGTLVRLNSKKSLKSSVASSHRASGTQSNSAIAKVHSTLRNVPQHGIIIENVRRIPDKKVVGNQSAIALTRPPRARSKEKKKGK